jgi:hypothetical protein
MAACHHLLISDAAAVISRCNAALRAWPSPLRPAHRPPGVPPPCASHPHHCLPSIPSSVPPPDFATAFRVLAPDAVFIRGPCAHTHSAPQSQFSSRNNELEQLQMTYSHTQRRITELTNQLQRKESELVGKEQALHQHMKEVGVEKTASEPGDRGWGRPMGSVGEGGKWGMLGCGGAADGLRARCSSCCGPACVGTGVAPHDTWCDVRCEGVHPSGGGAPGTVHLDAEYKLTAAICR